MLILFQLHPHNTKKERKKEQRENIYIVQQANKGFTMDQRFVAHLKYANGAEDKHESHDVNFHKVRFKK